jgi:hypothetical protein
LVVAATVDVDAVFEFLSESDVVLGEANLISAWDFSLFEFLMLDNGCDSGGVTKDKRGFLLLAFLVQLISRLTLMLFSFDAGSVVLRVVVVVVVAGSAEVAASVRLLRFKAFFPFDNALLATADRFSS